MCCRRRRGAAHSRNRRCSVVSVPRHPTSRRSPGSQRTSRRLKEELNHPSPARSPHWQRPPSRSSPWSPPIHPGPSSIVLVQTTHPMSIRSPPPRRRAKARRTSLRLHPVSATSTRCSTSCSSAIASRLSRRTPRSRACASEFHDLCLIYTLGTEPKKSHLGPHRKSGDRNPTPLVSLVAARHARRASVWRSPCKTSAREDQRAKDRVQRLINHDARSRVEDAFVSSQFE